MSEKSRLTLGEIDLTLLVEKNEARPLSRAARMGCYLGGQVTATGISLISDLACGESVIYHIVTCSLSLFAPEIQKYVKEIDNLGFPSVCANTI
jgi:hypothetical protein